MTSSHLSLNQNSSLKTGSMELNFLRSKASSFGDSLAVSEGNIKMPNLCHSVGAQGDDCENLKMTSQVFSLPVAPPGQAQSGANAVNTKGSKSISLSFFGEDQSEQKISNSPQPFFFAIPRDTSVPTPDFVTLVNHTLTRGRSFSSSSSNGSNSTSGPINQLVLAGFAVAKNNVSIHYHIRPDDESLGYFAALKFGGNPYLNSTYRRWDMWKVFCPWDLRTEDYNSFYVFFANMSHTVNFQGFVGFGIKQLTQKEFKLLCANNNTNISLTENQLNLGLDTYANTNFTASVATRVLLSGCYFIDKVTGLYSSYGMEVLETTSNEFTQCTSTHLTSFAGGLITVPTGINFNDVWANASFLDNITIYMTMIVMALVYVLCFIYSHREDKKDKRKTMIKILPDNECDDIYFYEVLFYTGDRFNAGTDSVVSLFQK